MNVKVRWILPAAGLLLFLAAAGMGIWHWYDNNVDRSGWVEKDGQRIYRDFYADPVSGWLELPEGTQCTCRCACTTPVFAAATAGGLEVRFPVCFQYAAHAPRTAAAISAAAIDESAPLDHAGRPSIVLRMVGEGERLWDIAKSYGTTAADILQANALEDGCPAAGQLLLIPRKR